jgi:hypothetical protein
MATTTTSAAEVLDRVYPRGGGSPAIPADTPGHGEAVRLLSRTGPLLHLGCLFLPEGPTGLSAAGYRLAGDDGDVALGGTDPGYREDWFLEALRGADPDDPASWHKLVAKEGPFVVFDHACDHESPGTLHRSGPAGEAEAVRFRDVNDPTVRALA